MKLEIHVKCPNKTISIGYRFIFLISAGNTMEKCLEGKKKWSITSSAGTMRKILTTKVHNVIPLLKMFSEDHGTSIIVAKVPWDLITER